MKLRCLQAGVSQLKELSDLSQTRLKLILLSIADNAKLVGRVLRSVIEAN